MTRASFAFAASLFAGGTRSIEMPVSPFGEDPQIDEGEKRWNDTTIFSAQRSQQFSSRK